jgi:hypothetical protein
MTGNVKADGSEFGIEQHLFGIMRPTFRKGIAGDWKNYFTPELKETYKESIGKFLIEFGYERDLSW